MQTRRQFLKRSAAWAGAAALPGLLPRSLFAQGMSAPDNGRILLVVQMMGGNDGINTVIPYQDGAYHSVRPTLALPDAQVLPIAQSGLAFHPRMAGFDRLYKDGHLAVVQGVGYPDPDLSHFRSTEIWQRADPADRALTGWLGRFLDAQHDRMLVDQGISIGTDAPLHLASDHGVLISVSDVSQFQVAGDDAYPADRGNQLTALQRLYSLPPDDGSALGLVTRTSRQSVDETFRIQKALDGSQLLGAYPDTDFGGSLRQIAQMILGGLPARVYNATIGGFDHHADQAQQHADLLGELSDTLAAFAQDMQAGKRWDQIAVITFSEFGRRVEENGSQGTDHGTASVMFAAGGGLKGGLYGAYPSLTALDGDGNLTFTTDFRAVYATVLDKWLGADADAILGPREDGQRFPRLGFL